MPVHNDSQQSANPQFTVALQSGRTVDATPAEPCKLWIVSVAGERRAVQTAPRRGARVKIEVEPEALQHGRVFLLCRKHREGVIVAASVHEEKLVEVRQRLGQDYEVEAALIEACP